jgi:hypothetical protein
VAKFRGNLKLSLEGKLTVLKQKPYMEQRKTAAEQQLAARVETLKARGESEERIRRDIKVRHFGAKARQARRQLADITELERLIARRSEIKAEKQASPTPAPARKKRVPSPEKNRAREEKRKMAKAADEDEA